MRQSPFHLVIVDPTVLHILLELLTHRISGMMIYGSKTLFQAIEFYLITPHDYCQGD